MKSIREAQNLILQHTRSFGLEKIDLGDSLYRVLGRDVLADRDYPPFNRSAMDGYAVRTVDLKTHHAFKVIDDIHAGELFKNEIGIGECMRIMTGAPVPAEAEAVIKSEDARKKGRRVRFNSAQIMPGQNIARQGEDIRAKDLLLWKGTMITAAQQVALAAVGSYQVPVAKLPEVSIYATGDEVFPVSGRVLPHHIRDSNSYALSALLQSYGVAAVLHNPVGDNPLKLKAAFQEGLAYDLMIISGGVSKGVADYVPSVLRSLGVRTLFHRVMIKPGNPLWVGISPKGSLVFALPGNPVSVQVAFKVFIEPFLRNCLGMSPLRPYYYPMNIYRKARSTFEEYFPAVLHARDHHTYLHPVAYNDSGDITATAHSDGLALHPDGVEHLDQGDPVAFYPWLPVSCN